MASGVHFSYRFVRCRDFPGPPVGKWPSELTFRIDLCAVEASLGHLLGNGLRRPLFVCCFQRSRGGPKVPPRTSQIEGKGSHHFDDHTLGTPRKSQCKVCVCAPAGHFLGLVLMTSLSSKSVRLRVGFCISLGGGPWEAVGVCDHPAGAVWLRGPGQCRVSGSIMSGGLLGVLFHVVPIALSGRSRQRTNLYEKWPPEAISLQVAQGSPDSVQIYTKSGLRTPFPSRWPREVPTAYKSIRKVASGGHFPAGGPERPRQRTNRYVKGAPEAIFPTGDPGGAWKRTNLHEK